MDIAALFDCAFLLWLVGLAVYSASRKALESAEKRRAIRSRAKDLFLP